MNKNTATHSFQLLSKREGADELSPSSQHKSSELEIAALISGLSFMKEEEAHATAIESLQTLALGPGRFTLTAERLRSGHSHRRDLSWVASLKGQKKIVASVRFTSIRMGDEPGLLLGPLVVDPLYKGQGLGRGVMKEALEQISHQAPSWVVLVGDQSYYRRFGFSQVPEERISLPGPVDPARLLIGHAGASFGELPKGLIRIASSPLS